MTNRFALWSVLLAGVASGACAQQANPPATAAAAPAEKSYTLEPGTKILLALKNEISTRSARQGDTVYFISQFPVVQAGTVVVPPETYVKGVIDSVQRAGKVKGKAELQLHFTTLIFPNGTEIPLPGMLDNVGSSSGAQVKNSEGTIQQGGTKGDDAKQVAATTTTGAGLGALAGWGAGNAGMGLGVGAGVGATAGVLSTLFTRGKDIVFTPGTTMEMVLNRPVTIQEKQLTGMPAYTGMR